MPDTFKIGRKVNWSYRCLPATAKCRFDGQTIRLRILFAADLDAVPDVLAIEKHVRQLTKAKTTVEELAIALFERFRLPVAVKGRTRTHGTIKAVVS